MTTVDVRFLYQAKTMYLFLDGVLDIFLKTADVRLIYQAKTIDLSFFLSACMS